MMDLEAARRGDENVSTPRELARLAEIGGEGRGTVSRPRQRPPRGRHRRRQRLAVPARLPAGTGPCPKPGSLEGVRCEAAWVDVPGRPYTAAIMTAYLRREADGEAAIRELSAAVYDTFDRLARSSEYGRIVNEGVTAK